MLMITGYRGSCDTYDPSDPPETAQTFCQTCQSSDWQLFNRPLLSTAATIQRASLLRSKTCEKSPSVVVTVRTDVI